LAIIIQMGHDVREHQNIAGCFSTPLYSNTMKCDCYFTYWDFYILVITWTKQPHKTDN